MDYDKMIETLRQHGVSCVRAHGRYCSICDEAATALSTIQAENEKLRVEAEGMRSNWYKSVEEIKKLRAELERVKRENDAIWIYIEIVDREYQRYMDRGYIDRLDELKRTWRRGPKKEN